MSRIPVVTQEHFKSKQGKVASHIMAFDNGQLVYCYGYERKKAKLVDKCKNYYLAHPCISKYKIHSNLFLAEEALEID